MEELFMGLLGCVCMWVVIWWFQKQWNKGYENGFKWGRALRKHYKVDDE